MAHFRWHGVQGQTKVNLGVTKLDLLFLTYHVQLLRMRYLACLPAVVVVVVSLVGVILLLLCLLADWRPNPRFNVAQRVQVSATNRRFGFLNDKTRDQDAVRHDSKPRWWEKLVVLLYFTLFIAATFRVCVSF